MKVKVTNLVVSATLDAKLNLSEIAKKLPFCEYNPSRFPGLVHQVKSPRASVLIFSSGKLICAGTTSMKDAKEVVEKVVGSLRRMGMKIGEPKIEVQNIVLTGDLEGFIDLVAIAETLTGVIYEPELFPGLILKFSEPKLSFLLFSSGRFVCAGAKSEEEVRIAVGRLEDKLESECLIVRL